MSTVIVNNKKGLGFLTTLTLIFITLKLTGFIGWSWWAVLAPVWIPALIYVAIFCFMIGLFIKTGKSSKTFKW